MGTVKRVSERRSLKKKTQYKAKATPYKKRTASNRLGRVTGLTRNDFGFPDRLSTKLVYGDGIRVNLVSGATNYWTFRLNSLFDPDYTGAGHQPQWFDQMAAVYRNYRVKGAKITVDFMPEVTDVPGNTQYGPYLVGITTSNQSSLSASSIASLTEDANGESKVIAPKESGRNFCTLSNTFSPLRDLGLDPMDGDLIASTSSNPNQAFYAHIWGSDMATNVSSAIRCRVKIEFQCEFFNRIEGVLS